MRASFSAQSRMQLARRPARRAWPRASRSSTPARSAPARAATAGGRIVLEPRGAGAHICGDGFSPGGEQPHHLAGDALYLEAVAVVAGNPFQAEPGGEGFFEVLGDDRADGADVLVVAQGVRGPPFAVGGGFGGVGDLGVDVQLHVAVAGGVLQPVRHGQVGLVPLAGLPPVHAGVVRSGTGIARLALEVAEPGMHGLPDHVVDLGDEGGPVLVAFAGRPPGGPGGRSRRGRRGRSRWTWTATELGRRRGGFAGFAWWLRSAARVCGRRWHAARRPAAGRTGRRLSGRRRGPAQRGTVGGFALAEEQVIGFALDRLAMLEAERLGPGPHQRPGGSPPVSLAWM